MTRRPSVNGKMPKRRDVAALRKGQIVEAAVAVIAEQGIQNLSLSAIEKKASMARGHLTYYFPAKEDILLAVFDHLLALMYQRVGTPGGQDDPCTAQESGSEWVRHLLAMVLLRPPASPEFHCLQYTFLSQIGHRADLRRRLASLYEEWRANMTRGLAGDLAGTPAAGTDPRLLATLVQALLHGLGMQLAADPKAFDREAMFQLCLVVLDRYLRPVNARGSHEAKQRARPRARPKR